jgi:hypothetical protein
MVLFRALAGVGASRHTTSPSALASHAPTVPHVARCSSARATRNVPGIKIVADDRFSRESSATSVGAAPARTASGKLLARNSLARCPPLPSRRAAGPTGGRQELEAVSRWRTLRRFWRRCFGNLRFGTTVGRFVRGLPCSAWCARHVDGRRAGGRPDFGQHTTADRRRRRAGRRRRRRPRRQGIPRRNRPIAALCGG